MSLAGAAAAGGLLLGISAAAYVPTILLLGRLFGRPWKRGPFSGSVALLVPARDEGERIAAKIANIRADPSRPERTEIVVVADGCRDETVAIARSSGARVLEFAEGAGKAARFNEIVPSLDAEVVVFTDATASWEPGTLARLLEPFADPEVGGTGASLRYGGVDDRGSAPSTRTYFDLETRIRIAESRLDSTTGFSGSLYAIRKELHRPLRSDANEDFQAALDVVLAGRRAVIADAEVRDEAHLDWRAEFRMRRRVIARSLRCLLSRPALVGRRPKVALFLVFHKLLRFSVWGSATLVVTGSVVLLGGSWPNGLAAALLAGLGTWAEAEAIVRLAPALGKGPIGRRLVLAAHLIRTQFAAMLALVDVLFGRTPTSWRPDREGSSR
jgi:cellulose synthase/poly-beta-1,6-N-acetylglucosamine synthase-like glycosyltransferase